MTRLPKPLPRRVLIACGCALIGLAWVVPTHAQSADASTTAAARALAIEGMRLAQDGDCASAIDQLERAEALHHAPIVLEQLAECQIEAGRLVLGTEQLRRVLAEPLPAQPSPALQKAHKRARRSLETNTPKLALLTIRVSEPLGVTPAVRVDGQPLPDALLDAECPSDPGHHVIEARAPFFLTAHAEVALQQGEHRTITFELQPLPQSEAREPSTPELLPKQMPAPSREPAPAPPAKADTPIAPANMRVDARVNPRERDAAYVALGVGAVTLASGLGFGLAALTERSDLDQSCPNRVCPPQEHGRIGAGRTFGTISTLSFVTSLAALGLGTFLFFDSAAGGAHAAARASEPRLGVGLARRGLALRFE